MQITVNRDSVVATGTTEEIIECLFGPSQHDEHMKGWRWHLYMSDMQKREDAVWACMRQMLAERRACETFQQAAE